MATQTGPAEVKSGCSARAVHVPGSFALGRLAGSGYRPARCTLMFLAEVTTLTPMERNGSGFGCWI